MEAELLAFLLVWNSKVTWMGNIHLFLGGCKVSFDVKQGKKTSKPSKLKTPQQCQQKKSPCKSAAIVLF